MGPWYGTWNGLLPVSVGRNAARSSTATELIKLSRGSQLAMPDTDRRRRGRRRVLPRAARRARFLFPSAGTGGLIGADRSRESGLIASEKERKKEKSPLCDKGTRIRGALGRPDTATISLPYYGQFVTHSRRSRDSRRLPAGNNVVHARI